MTETQDHDEDLAISAAAHRISQLKIEQNTANFSTKRLEDN